MKKQILILTCIGLLGLHEISGEEQVINKALIPSTNQIVLKVDGVVCSFCAYGLEKSISTLPFVEKSLFGGDGVFVDVEKGMITVAINPKEKIDILGTVRAITKAGYVAREIHMWVSGYLEVPKEKTLFTDSHYTQAFSLTQKTGETYKPTSSRNLTLYVLYEVPKKMKKIDFLPVVVIDDGGQISR
ncbi:MAG: heavy-metal-associated domain-containing protein [Candidatus Margulisbacteria bacterium]|nr:heavy-metal-associated domain-containing protein [Candidatus Margulisiibacteriota bacterium]